MEIKRALGELAPADQLVQRDAVIAMLGECRGRGFENAKPRPFGAPLSRAGGRCAVDWATLSYRPVGLQSLLFAHGR